jgi:hypothetical protein
VCKGRGASRENHSREEEHKTHHGKQNVGGHPPSGNAGNASHRKNARNQVI